MITENRSMAEMMELAQVPPKPAYSKAEVARILVVGTHAIDGMIGRGEIKGAKVGKIWRIPHPALNEYIAARFL